jgi:hypothetical protein
MSRNRSNNGMFFVIVYPLLIYIVKGTWGLGLDETRDNLVLWEAPEAETGRKVIELVQSTTKSFTFRLANKTTVVCSAKTLSIACCNNIIKTFLENVQNQLDGKPNLVKFSSK